MALSAPRFQPGSRNTRIEALAQSELETFGCTVVVNPFTQSAFGLAGIFNTLTYKAGPIAANVGFTYRFEESPCA
jgi:hypothetical protein